MIREIKYKNFKAIRDAILPLAQFTLIIGANGTGKSSAMDALNIVADKSSYKWRELVSSEAIEDREDVVIGVTTSRTTHKFIWSSLDTSRPEGLEESYAETFDAELRRIHWEELTSFQKYSFDPRKIAQSVNISKNPTLVSDGSNLAGVLDLLKDTEPERWKYLNEELEKWFPEFDQILFDRYDNGKSIVLRTRIGKHKIKAVDLSDGILVSLAYLTVAHLPQTTQTVCFEEPEKGLHPRMLRYVQDAMYRLCYPENFNDDRKPIQVIAITHSPYLLDLYKDHPEEIVISSKDKDGVHFERLTDKPYIDEILQGEALGEIWFTGILGGVPSHV